jgi:hypothetical protein
MLLSVTPPYSAAYAAQKASGPEVASNLPLPPGRQYWGAETNGVKVGLYSLLAPDSTNRVQVYFVPVALNISTNNRSVPQSDILVLSLPPLQNRYRMELTGADGRPVRKTKWGQALGEPYVYHRPSGVVIGNGQPPGFTTTALSPNKPASIFEMRTGLNWKYLWLDLQDYFKIKKSGTYHLRFQMSSIFWHPEPEERLLKRLITFPPVEADLDLQLPPKPPNRLVAYAKDYGVDVLGYAVCIAGAVWLVAHRLRHRTPKLA